MQNTTEQPLTQPLLNETLRDRFALAALQGMLAYNIDVSNKTLATLAYGIADAMLVERKKKGE